MLDVVPLRTPTLPPATHTNCTLLEGPTGWTVVDPASPWAPEQERLSDALRIRGPVARIFLTHHHHDHVSGAVALQRELGVPIVAHPLTAALLADSVPVDHVVHEGMIDDWQVLHTPGHATGHLCLWQARTGRLIAGDMVAGQGTIVLEPPEGNLADYLASLALLAALEPKAVHPAHGPTQTAAVLHTYIAHRNARTEQISAALGQAPQTPVQLVGQVYGDTIPRFVYPLAARQVTCHLQWLQDRGRAAHTDAGWVSEDTHG